MITLDPCPADQMFLRALVATTRDPSVSVWRNKTHIFLCADARSICCDDEPSTALDSFAAAIEASRTKRPSLDASTWCPLSLGWLSYDAMRGDEPGANDDQRPNGDYAPRAVLLQFSSVLRASILDHSVEVCARDANAEQRLRDLWLSASQHSLEPIAEISVHSQTDEQTHLAAIAQVKESILDGDVYLVNVARVLHSDTALTPQQMAVRVHRANSCYGAIMRGHGVTLAAMSMELGLRVDRVKNELETSPIKGTRPRSTDVQLDQRLALELEQSPKERAENVMAVDVHRNDLGKFAEVGSVVVHALCAVESHAYVHHLVSQIRCKISETTSTVAILRAMSPVGSVTGAPKRSAMQTIAQLERERRGVYTGFYGAVWPDGSMELAVAIRTIVNDCLGAHFGCGGGIVYDSDPDTEWQELQWKQRALSGKITNL